MNDKFLVNMQSMPSAGIWHQEDFYRIRKKVLTMGSKYGIEDSAGKVSGFCKQKLLRLKEEIMICCQEKHS